MSKDVRATNLVPTAGSSGELLPVLAAAQQELAGAKTLPDVLPVIHLAAAVAAAAERAAKLAGVRGAAMDVVEAASEAAREAAVLRIEAQARAGELLREMAERGERHQQRGDHVSESLDATRSLAELGLSKSESSRWQRLAAVPAEVRQAYVVESRTAGREVTINGLLRYASGKREETTPKESAPRPGHPSPEEIRVRSREVYRDVVRATELPKYDAWMVAHALDGRERRQLDVVVEALIVWLADLRKALNSYEHVRDGK